MKKTVIITGAFGNLGKAVLLQLLRDGYQVAGTKLHNESFDDLKANGNFEEHEVDVTNPDAVKALMAGVVDKHGAVDRAALLVGGYAMGDIESTSLEDVQKMIKLNFESAFVCAKLIFEQMLRQKQGGRIVLVGAKPALDAKAAKGQVAYALSKSLIFRLADILNASGQEKGIHTSVIVPSIIDTPPNRESMPKANFEDWVKPEEIAEVISFLFSEQASKVRESVVKIYGNI